MSFVQELRVLASNWAKPWQDLNTDKSCQSFLLIILLAKWVYRLVLTQLVFLQSHNMHVQHFVMCKCILCSMLINWRCLASSNLIFIPPPTYAGHSSHLLWRWKVERMRLPNRKRSIKNKERQNNNITKERKAQK